MSDSAVIIQTEGWRVKVFLGIGGLVTIVILAFLYRLEIGIILLGLGTVGAVRLGFWAKHKYDLEVLAKRQLLAQTRQIELEADRQYWQVEQERATAARMTAEQYFLETKSGTFVIGDIPFKFYPSAAASKQLADPAIPLLPAPSLDFFQVMSESHQAYAIVGPQRVGKSIMAQHLAHYLTRQGVSCLVVGTKAAPGEWLNCDRRIGNEAAPVALASLLAEIKSRIEASVNTPKLAVFLDDWLNTVALEPALAEAFFLEGATRILTTGIVPYFLLQSDSKADWGTKHGAQLKNNFLHLLLGAPRENGRLDYTRIRATVIYPGEKEAHPVRLPAGLPMFGESEIDVNLATPAEPEPTEQERRVLDLFNEGASMAQICEAVYGYKSSNRYPDIRAIIDRFGSVQSCKSCKTG